MLNIDHLNLSKSGLVFDSRTGDSYQLNISARRIIELLQIDQSVEKAAEILADEFNINYEAALGDMIEFQLQLSIMGLSR